MHALNLRRPRSATVCVRREASYRRNALDERFARKPAERRAYTKLHYIPDVDLSSANFVEFTDERRELTRARLREELGLE